MHEPGIGHCLLGIEQDRTREEHGIIFVVASVEIQYQSPARFNDALEVSVTVPELKNASLTFAQEVTRSGDVLCRATVLVASVDANTFRPRRLPSEIREAAA